MTIARLNGIDINYELHGSVHGDGTPLVLAHGYTASLELWRDQVAPLSEKYRLVIYDIRGHGKTSAPESMDAYGLATDYVADQIALMDHLGIQQAHVGGLSMGGMIAQEFALQHPERLRSLLLLDTGPGGSYTAPSALQERMTQFREVLRGIAKTKGMSAIIDMMREGPMAIGPLRRTPAPPALQRFVEGMREMGVDGFLGGAEAMQRWAGTVDRLHSITAPTLVLVGENDNLLEASRVMHEKIAGSRFVLLRNCGHGSNMWRPGAFLRAVTEFLADVEAGTPVAGESVIE